MAWFDRNSREMNWVWLLTIYGESVGHGGYSYQLNRNGEIAFDNEKVLEKFLSEIDSQDLVILAEPRHEEVDPSSIIFGGRNYHTEQASLFCREDDIAKLNTDEPVHFQCLTEIETEDKEGFIEVIRLFIDN